MSGRKRRTELTTWLTLRISRDEAARIAEHARARGIKASKVIRECLAPVLRAPVEAAAPTTR
jgi:hypothetical protein